MNNDDTLVFHSLTKNAVIAGWGFYHQVSTRWLLFYYNQRGNKCSFKEYIEKNLDRIGIVYALWFTHDKIKANFNKKNSSTTSVLNKYRGTSIDTKHNYKTAEMCEY